MKALYKGEVMRVKETVGDVVVLDPVGSEDEDDFIEVPLSDPDLIVDPTDGDLGY